MAGNNHSTSKMDAFERGVWTYCRLELKSQRQRKHPFASWCVP
jgi:hypothetical protein